MRFKTSFIICVIVFLTQLLAFSQQKYNLNFDDFDKENQKLPTGWFKWGNFEIVTGEKINHENSVGKVVSDKKGTFGCIAYSIPANYVGDTIKLSGRIKYENVEDYVGLLMRIDGFSGKSALAFESMQKLKIKGSSDWKEYSIKLAFPSNAKTIIVGGILGKKGVAWFDDFKITIDGIDIQTLNEAKKPTLENLNSDELSLAITKSSIQLDLSNQDNLHLSLDSLIAKVGNKKIVAIGESTHGTSEFYKLREVITKRLIKEKGFNLVVLENPYDDIELLNQNLSLEPIDDLIRKHLFSIYQTKEIKSFLQWYKDNRANFHVEFKGCDDSFWVFHELLTSQTISFQDKKLNNLLEKLKSNILKSTTHHLRKQQKANVLIYVNILEIEKYLKLTNKLTQSLEEILLNGKTTYINYINISKNKPIESRDEIMAKRISFLANNQNAKIVVWAHNAHISNKVITDNEIGIMGRNLKREFGDDYHSIGLMTSKGNYSYIEEKFINGDHDYSDKLKNANFLATEKFSWEQIFSQNGKAFYIDMSKLNTLFQSNEIIGSSKLIGYSKETQEDIYYLPIIKLFDSLLFIEETNATESILK